MSIEFSVRLQARWYDYGSAIDDAGAAMAVALAYSW